MPTVHSGDMVYDPVCNTAVGVLSNSRSRSPALLRRKRTTRRSCAAARLLLRGKANNGGSSMWPSISELRMLGFNA